MKKNPANIILSFRKRISKALIALFSFFTLSCDFQNPMAFEMPTWFFFFRSAIRTPGSNKRGLECDRFGGGYQSRY